ncbi:MAG: hypothetical protein AB1679_15230 [Actinomycetota bacterium]
MGRLRPYMAIQYPMSSAGSSARCRARAMTDRPLAPPAATYSAAMTTAAERMPMYWRRYWAKPILSSPSPAMKAALVAVTRWMRSTKRASRSAARS